MALVGRARNVVFLGGASVISCNRTSHGELYYISQIQKKFFATPMSVLLLNFVDFYYMLGKIINFFIIVMIDGDDFFQ